jgi:hypothetical protein
MQPSRDGNRVTVCRWSQSEVDERIAFGILLLFNVENLNMSHPMA